MLPNMCSKTDLEQHLFIFLNQYQKIYLPTMILSGIDPEDDIIYTFPSLNLKKEGIVSGCWCCL